MKILVYYLGVQNLTRSQADILRDETITKLETKFPSLKNQMIVIMQKGSDSDHMEVLDMSPQYYPQAYAYHAPYGGAAGGAVGGTYSGPY